MATDKTKWPRAWSIPGYAPLNTRPTSPSSGAYYKVLFASPTGNGRVVTAESNSTAFAGFAVPWDDRAQFETDSLGYSDYTTGLKYLKRRLPLRHGDPAQQSFRLRQLTTISHHNYDTTITRAMTTSDGSYSEKWPATQMVAYRGDFVQRKYAFAEDADVMSAAVPELKRYVTKFPETEAYHRKIPGYGFAFESNVKTPCLVLASLPEFMQRWVYTSYQWPWSFDTAQNSIPLDYIANTLGKVNNATFDPDLRFTTSAGSTQDGFLTETLKFEDHKMSEPYYGSDDKLYVDQSFIFLWNPRNWNKQIKPNTSPRTYEYIKQLDAGGTFLSPDAFSYEKADFNKLFWPRGA